MTLLSESPVTLAGKWLPGPLADVVGAGLAVPLVTGGTVAYANLDYAASAPALRAVADRVAELLPLYSSVHRGAGYASAACTSAYEAARATVASFTGARDDDVVIFTRNTTDALNLLASAVPRHVVHLDIEHHANLLPWQARTERLGRPRVVTARATLAGTLAAVRDELAAAPAALLAVTGASNVTGECLPLAELADLAHAHRARIAVDGAQLVPHRRVDLAATGIDYLAFSGHKLYAPFGTGVLVGRRDWLDTAPPYLPGGGAVREVRLAATDWAPSPARHEGGTPNVVGAVALAAACQFVDTLPPGAAEAHERLLTDRLIAGLASLDGIRTLRLWPGPENAARPGQDRPGPDRVAVVSFTVDGWPARHVAEYLSAEHGIGVRDGRFCAHPLLSRLAPASVVPDGAAVRASLGLGSRAADVDRLVTALRELRAHGPSWTYTGPADGYRPVPDPRALPQWLTAGPPGPASPCAG